MTLLKFDPDTAFLYRFFWSSHMGSDGGFLKYLGIETACVCGCFFIIKIKKNCGERRVAAARILFSPGKSGCIRTRALFFSEVAGSNFSVAVAGEEKVQLEKKIYVYAYNRMSQNIYRMRAQLRGNFVCVHPNTINTNHRHFYFLYTLPAGFQ